MDKIGDITSSDLLVRLCKALFCAEYKDFQTIDDSGGDAGNDGYSPSAEILIQIYCPEKPEKTNDTSYKSKIKNDLDKAKKLADSGKYKIKEWIFITPRELRETVQTYLREEATSRGFIGIAWASPKLTELLSKHSHLRNQFPELIQPDIEGQLADIKLTILNGSSVDDANAKFKTRLEQHYQQRIDKAKVFLDQGKSASAKKEYDSILVDLEAETEKIDSHIYFRVYNNLGVCEMNLNNHAKAAELFEKAYKAEPGLPMATAKLALSKFFKGVPAEGLPIVDSLLEKNPDDDHVISIKANILQALGNYAELISFLRSKGKVALIHWYEGFERMSSKDYEGAIASFEALLRIEPENIRALMLIAQNVMVGMKDVVRDNPLPPDRVPPEIKDKFLRAIECLAQAVILLKNSEQKEDLEMAYANLSGCYVALGSYDESIKAASEAIAIDPTSAVPFLNKGIAQLKLGNNNGAIESFKTYKDLGGDDIDVDRHIALCSLNTGDLKTAEGVVEVSLEKDGVIDLDIAELAIELYSRKLNTEKLNSLLARLEADFSNNPQALRIRARYLQKRGLEGAEDLIRKALANTNSPSERMLSEIDLADLYYDQKDYERAGEIYKKYLNAQDGNQATYRYAECMYDSGQHGAFIAWVETLTPEVRQKNSIKRIEAYTNLFLGNLGKASQLFRELSEKNPSNIQYLVYYGMCRFRLGHEEDTKNAYDAIKARVTETQDLLTLAAGYEMIGDWDSAVELTFKALEDDPNNPKAHLAFIFTFLKREQSDKKEFEDKHIKAFQKSIAEFNKRFPEEKALQSFEVKDNDISGILHQVDQMAEVTDNATNLYKDSKVPMAVIPQLIGRKPFDVWAAFTNMKDIGIKMSFGAPDETATEIGVIERSENSSIVVDLYPLFLLGHFDRLELLPKLFKKIYIHQSVLDELIEEIDDRKISINKGVTMLGKSNGQHRMDEIPPEQVKKSFDLLIKVKTFLTQEKNVEIRGFSKEEPKDTENIINALHASTRDSALLAQELGIPFYCDDRILRAVLKRDHKVSGFSS